MKDSKDFPHPLNTFIEEEVEVATMVPRVNEKEKRVEFVKGVKKVKQKTYYADSKPVKIVCSDHRFVCLDKGKYLFKCKKCTWHKIAYPVTFKFDEKTGILTYRRTGIKV